VAHCSGLRTQATGGRQTSISLLTQNRGSLLQPLTVTTVTLGARLVFAALQEAPITTELVTALGFAVLFATLGTPTTARTLLFVEPIPARRLFRVHQLLLGTIAPLGNQALRVVRPLKFGLHRKEEPTTTIPHTFE